MKLGSHMSTAGGCWKAIRARSVDCESTQIFVKSNMQWFGKPPKPADAERFKGELAKGDVGTVFGHAGYLINLAGPDGDNLDKSMESLSQEIEFATTLGVPFLVLHPGAHLGQARRPVSNALPRRSTRFFGPRKNRRFGLRWKTPLGRAPALDTRSGTWLIF